MRAIDQERRLLLSCMQDQAEAAACTSSSPVPEAAVTNNASNSGYAPQGEASMPTGHCNASATAPKHSHAPGVAAVTQSSNASLHAGENLTIQRSVSDGTVLPGSLRQRFAFSVPAQHATSACSAWRVQPSPLKSEGSQTASSLQNMGAAAAGAAQRGDGAAGVTAQAEPSIEAHSASHVDGACKVEKTVTTSGSSALYQHASMLSATSNGWHLRASNQAGAVTRRRHSGYAELQAYSQKKEALCPTIKNCIQEVLQLRAQLSVDSLQLGSSLE